MEFDDEFLNDIEEMFGFLMESGYIEQVGFDMLGEPIYKMTSKMIHDFPEMFDIHMSITNEIIFSLWQKGLIEMKMDDSEQWTVVPTYSTYHYMDIDIDLDQEEILMLEEIIRIDNHRSQS